MAVIESKGNGYSLFNGVKLPSLPAWDKETYPYVVIAMHEGIYYLIAKKTAVAVNSENTTMVAKAQVTAKVILLFAITDSLWVSTNIENTFESMTPVWGNHDVIITADNSVYLAASDPIPVYDSSPTLVPTLVSKVYRVNMFTKTPITNGIKLITLDGYTLKDSDRLYLTTKADIDLLDDVLLSLDDYILQDSSGLYLIPSDYY